MNSRLLDYQPDLEFLPSPRTPRVAPVDAGLASAAELLEVDGLAKMRQFLARLIDRTAGHTRLAAPLRSALLAALLCAARVALPLAVRGPLIHALAVGGSAALQARGAHIFGIELEGLSPEDMEFELARHFVHFVTEAARRAACSADAQAAVVQAARQYAPGLLAAAAQAARRRPTGAGSNVFDC